MEHESLAYTYMYIYIHICISFFENKISVFSTLTIVSCTDYKNHSTFFMIDISECNIKIL